MSRAEPTDQRSPVSHPRLSQPDLDRIAIAHGSADAVLLLREIERLRAVESYVRQLIQMAQEMPGDTPKLIAVGLAAALDGRLPGGGQFRLDSLSNGEQNNA